jgi:hypothetical protein
MCLYVYVNFTEILFFKIPICLIVHLCGSCLFFWSIRSNKGDILVTFTIWWYGFNSIYNWPIYNTE